MKDILYYNLDENCLEYKKNTISIDELKKIDQDINLCLLTDSYDKQTIDKLQSFMEEIKDSNIKIDSLKSYYNDSYLYDKEDFKNIKLIDSFCKEHGICYKVKFTLGERLMLLPEGDFDQIVIAKQKIENFIDVVNHLTIEENGKEVPLSVSEKFMLAYRFTSNREYHIDEDVNNIDMKNWIGLLSTDFAICSGFSSLLKCICERMFTENEVKCFEQHSGTKESPSEHSNLLVYIKDDKYGIDNVFYCDPCYDHATETEDSKFNFFLIPFEEIVNGQNPKPIFYNNNILYKEFHPLLKERESFFIKSNSFDNYFYNKYKLKNPAQIKSEFIEFKHLKELKETAIEDEKLLLDKVYTKMEELENDEDIKKVLSLKIPQNLSIKNSEENAIVTKFYQYISNFELNTIPDKKLFKEFYSFYCNNQDIFKESEGKLNFTLYSLLKDNLYYNNTKYIDTITEIAKLERKYTEELYQKIFENEQALIKYARPHLHPARIPTSLLKRGFKAIQKLENNNNPNFEQKKLSERRLFELMRRLSDSSTGGQAKWENINIFDEDEKF